MMKISRNALCPCNSGKKHKKCCLVKEAKANAENIIAERTAANEKEQQDERQSEPHWVDAEANDGLYEAKFSQFWEEFNTAESVQKASMIKKAFDEPELMNNEDIFELFNALDSSISCSSERELYIDLVEQLKINSPDIYQNEVSNLMSVCVSYALIDKQRENVATYFTELAKFASTDIDIFNSSLDQLAYYDYLDLLVQAMRIGWQNVAISPDIIPQGVEKYRHRGFDFELLYYISHAIKPSLDDKQLVTVMEHYGYFDQELLSHYFTTIALLEKRNWCKDDFEYSINNSQNSLVSVGELLENICQLTNEFMGYLQQTKTMPPSRAEMIRTELKSYLQRRAKGELKKRADPRKKKRKLKKTHCYAHSILTPDRITFDWYLGEKIQFLSFQVYRAFALYECIPAWLEFLQSKMLIDEAGSKSALEDISRLYDSVEGLTHRLVPHENYILEQLHQCWSIQKNRSSESK